MSFKLARKTGWLSLFLTVILPFGSLAAAPKSSTTESLQLSVEPSILRLELAQGEQWQGTLTLKNPNPRAITYALLVIPYQTLADGTSVPQLTGFDPQAEGVALWATTSANTVVVAASSTVSVALGIQVPETASPDDYRGAVLVGVPGGASSEATILGTTSYVATGIALRVRGVRTARAFLQEFSSVSSAYFTPPVLLLAKLRNTGTIPIAPTGKIAIAQTLLASNATNGEHTVAIKFPSILPGQTASLETEWHPPHPLSVGRFSAAITILYGKEKIERLAETLSFWYISPFLLAAGCMILLLVVIVVFFVRRRRA